MTDLEDHGQKIPPDITYDGTNAEQVMAWARATLRHYEKPLAEVNGVSYAKDEMVPIIQVHTDMGQRMGFLQPGDKMTYDERTGFEKVPVPDQEMSAAWNHYNDLIGRPQVVTERQEPAVDQERQYNANLSAEYGLDPSNAQQEWQQLSNEWDRMNPETGQIERVPPGEVFDRQIDPAPELGPGRGATSEIAFAAGVTRSQSAFDRDSGSIFAGQKPMSVSEHAARYSSTDLQGSISRHPAGTKLPANPPAYGLAGGQGQSIHEIAKARGISTNPRR